MSLKYGLLTLLLLCMILFLVLKNYELWTQPMESTRGKEEVTRSVNKPEPVLILKKGNDPASANSYLSIGERNIFSPERKDFSTTPVEQPKPTVRPQIILYGVAIAPEYQSALVADPGSPLSNGKLATRTIKVGDRMGEYQLAKILPDRITMEAPGVSFDVLLYEPKAPKKKPEIRTADVKAIQASPAATSMEVQKPESQPAVMITKEPKPERVAPPQTILDRGAQFPNRSLARQSRKALISQPHGAQ